MTVPRYNKVCVYGQCTSWRREDDALCKGHYLKVPQRYRSLLWEEDPVKYTANLRMILSILAELEEA